MCHFPVPNLLRLVVGLRGIFDHLVWVSWDKKYREIYLNSSFLPGCIDFCFLRRTDKKLSGQGDRGTAKTVYIFMCWPRQVNRCLSVGRSAMAGVCIYLKRVSNYSPGWHYQPYLRNDGIYMEEFYIITHFGNGVSHGDDLCL